MVKRVLLSLLPLLLFATPGLAQEFPRVEVGFGYGNYAVESQTTLGATDRVHGFAMHSGFNLLSWFGVENYTGAYSVPNDITLITNIFGAKLAARDLIEGRISPYVVAGFGIGYYTSNVTRNGFSTSATRLGGGIDFNLNTAMAFKVDVSSIGLGSGLITDDFRSNLNVSTGIVFNLGF